MSAQSVTEPIPQFHDRDGQPLDGGFIYVGQAGLDAQTNQIPIYFDPAMTLPVAQPVRTLNGYPSSSGSAFAFYAGAGDFSITILDAQGLLVLSAPNVTTRIDMANIDGSISSALISFLQAGTGAVLRTVESKLRDSVSVFDFMTTAQIAAVKASTFAVDVTTPINAAIASGAREVFFPQGGYAISAPITIGSPSVGVSLVGAGRQATVIRNTGVNTPAVKSIGNAVLYNTSIRIADMSLEGQNGTGDGVLLDYTLVVVLERLDCYAHGLSGISMHHSAYVAVDDCWSRSNFGNALSLGPESYFVNVKGGNFETSANGVVIFGDGPLPPRHITFTGSAFRGAIDRNVAITTGALDVRFFGCDFTAIGGTTTAHLSVNSGAGATVSNVLVDGCTFFGNNATNTITGIFLNDCADTTVTNSVVDCTGSAAYTITASAARTRLVNNSIVLGTTSDSSSSTVQVFPTGAETAIARASSYTGATTFDFGGGYAKFNVGGSINAFRFRLLPFSDGEVFEINGWRTWVDASFLTLRIKGLDPVNSGDGLAIGPGVDSFTYANLPGAPIGYVVQCIDIVFPMTFGDIVNMGGGSFAAFIIWNGTNWTVCGV